MISAEFILRFSQTPWSFLFVCKRGYPGMKKESLLDLFREIPDEGKAKNFTQLLFIFIFLKEFTINPSEILFYSRYISQNTFS